MAHEVIAGQRINRNIVECKVRKHQHHSGERIPVLIETLWNVKMLEGKMAAIPKYGINRNIVECKVV